MANGSVFNVGKNLIDVTLYYTFKKNKAGNSNLIILDEVKAKKMLEDEKKKADVNILQTKWRNVTWKEQNDLVKATTKHNPMNNGRVDVDYGLYRDLRIKTCLVRWDAKDENNQDIPVTKENIENMDSVIVTALVDRYETAITPDDEEEKKTS